MERKLFIKLISPKMSLRPMDSEMKRRMSPSLSLLTIASLTPKEHKVVIEDENIKPINYDDKPDIVGITVNVDTSYRAFIIAEKFKKKGTKVVFGGIHASANPDQMLKHCHTVCIGEAEMLWKTIINDHLNDRLQETYSNKENVDLEKVPLIDWSKINKKNYLYNNVIVTSRGCPFKCDFCYNSCDYLISGFRNRPIPDVVKEIRGLKSKHVMIIDDNFIGNIRWTKDFLKVIKPMRLTWHAAVSANLVKYPELITEMADCGCKSLFIGFESIDNRSIESVHKAQNKIENYETLIKMIHDNRIMINASLVFGFDHDTKETFDNTLKWLVKNKIETMTAHILTPYPGTILYKKLETEGRIVNYDHSKYNTSNVIFQPKYLSMDELKKGYLKMYENFYSLKNIWRRRPDHPDSFASYLLFNFGYRKFGKLTASVGKLGFMNLIGKVARKLSYGI